jgi:hypothetical protein
VSVRPVWIAFVAIVLGCASQSYTPSYRGMADARSRVGYEPTTAPLQIVASTDVGCDFLELVQRGYAFLGQSSPNAAAPPVSDSQLRSLASRVGAQLVLVAPQYADGVRSATFLSLPRVTASGAGASTTTCRSPNRTAMAIMPPSIGRGDFAALYFARVRGRLGLLVAAPDESVDGRQRLDVGVRVTVVVDGSPAFDADIRPGDVVTHLGGARVQSVAEFARFVDENDGKSVDIVLTRDGRGIRKTVTLLSLTHAR